LVESNLQLFTFTYCLIMVYGRASSQSQKHQYQLPVGR
jgi:hypothetical protein